jgi:uncharacterized protein (DUF736 family)
LKRKGYKIQLGIIIRVLRLFGDKLSHVQMQTADGAQCVAVDTDEYDQLHAAQPIKEKKKAETEFEQRVRNIVGNMTQLFDVLTRFGIVLEKLGLLPDPPPTNPTQAHRSLKCMCHLQDHSDRYSIHYCRGICAFCLPWYGRTTNATGHVLFRGLCFEGFGDDPFQFGFLMAAEDLAKGFGEFVCFVLDAIVKLGLSKHFPSMTEDNLLEFISFRMGGGIDKVMRTPYDLSERVSKEKLNNVLNLIAGRVTQLEGDRGVTVTVKILLKEEARADPTYRLRVYDQGVGCGHSEVVEGCKQKMLQTELMAPVFKAMAAELIDETTTAVDVASSGQPYDVSTFQPIITREHATVVTGGDVIDIATRAALVDKVRKVFLPLVEDLLKTITIVGEGITFSKSPNLF